jgi:RNA-directed DNA polymerase
VRYADDCNVYVRSKRAGERVMERMVRLYAKLKLKVNEEKSTVARVWERKFLGYSFWVAPGKLVKRRVAPKALEDFKERIREITSRNGGRSLAKVVEELRSYMLGWKAYFRLADTPGVFRRSRPVDRPKAADGATQTVEAGDDGVPGTAEGEVCRAGGSGGGGSRRSWWRIAGHGALNTAMPTKYLEGLGLPKLAPH